MQRRDRLEPRRAAAPEDTTAGADDHVAPAVELDAVGLSVRQAGIGACPDPFLFVLLFSQAVEAAAGRGPDVAVGILGKRRQRRARKAFRLAVDPRLSLSEAHGAARLAVADPEASIPCHEQRPDGAAQRRVGRRGRPGDEADAVESKQSGIGADPEVAVLVLDDGPGIAEGKPVFLAPGGDGVLGEDGRQVGPAGSRRKAGRDGEDGRGGGESRGSLHCSAHYTFGVRGRPVTLKMGIASAGLREYK